MFTSVKTAAKFAPDRPSAQLLNDNQDCRVFVLGFEPGQSLPLQTSSSTVLLHVVEGWGRLQVGESSRDVVGGDLSFCPPNIPHTLAASDDSRMIVLIIIAPRP